MAQHSHQRDANARRKPKAVLVAGPLAFVATAAAVTLGILATDPAASDPVAARDATSDISHPREELVSRSQSRMDAAKLQRQADARKERAATRKDRAATLKAVKQADTRLWTTTLLNLWTESGKDARHVGEIKTAKRILVTGRHVAGRDEIVIDGESRWVTSGYLSEDKPVAAAAGLSSSPCADSGIESGLTSNAVLVYRSVCNAFPQVTAYGGWDSHGEHSTGRAIDIMTSDSALGTAIAEFLQSHAAELHLYDVIWSQHIWTPERSSEGWRSMSDRGSTTANHYDHVHVSTY